MDAISPTEGTKLAQLARISTIVADTGDLEAVKAAAPVDCTTNPSLILKAAQMPAYRHVVEEAGRRGGGDAEAVLDWLAVLFGAELTRIVPGRVSTEVDSGLSFDTQGTIAKAERLIGYYETLGIARDRILIKTASTWEGIRAAETLERAGINCNLTLLFSFAQAVACADAGVFLISPFVGRILDWHTARGEGPFEPDTDPGVRSVRRIYHYYKSHGYRTVVMAASFRSVAQIEALAGCDRLTISPALLTELAQQKGPVPRRLPAEGAETETRVGFDEKGFRWAMNEDAMATEKLSDGIRQFHADTEKLRKAIAAERL